MSFSMEFRRITNLPPYVFTIINGLKMEARRAGADVIDLGFGNPDIPSPQIAVDKLAEAAQIARNHRYSMSKGLPKLREAVAALYKRNWDVDLDTELEITNTIGSKEGFSHLMWCFRPRRCRHRAEPELSDPHLRSAVRRCRSAPGAHASLADPACRVTSRATSSTASPLRTTSAGRSRASW